MTNQIELIHVWGHVTEKLVGEVDRPLKECKSCGCSHRFGLDNSFRRIPGFGDFCGACYKNIKRHPSDPEQLELARDIYLENERNYNSGSPLTSPSHRSRASHMREDAKGRLPVFTLPKESEAEDG